MNLLVKMGFLNIFVVVLLTGCSRPVIVPDVQRYYETRKNDDATFQINKEMNQMIDKEKQERENIEDKNV